MEGIVDYGGYWVGVAISGLELGGVEELIGEGDLATLTDEGAVEGEAWREERGRLVVGGMWVNVIFGSYMRDGAASRPRDYMEEAFIW